MSKFKITKNILYLTRCFFVFLLFFWRRSLSLFCSSREEFCLFVHSFNCFIKLLIFLLFSLNCLFLVVDTIIKSLNCLFLVVDAIINSLKSLLCISELLIKFFFFRKFFPRTRGGLNRCLREFGLCSSE